MKSKKIKVITGEYPFLQKGKEYEVLHWINDIPTVSDSMGYMQRMVYGGWEAIKEKMERENDRETTN